MMPRGRPLTPFALVALLAAGLAGAAESPVASFGPGEQIDYEISYLGLTAARAQVTVGAPTEQWGKPVWPIVALAATNERLSLYSVKNKFVTYWDFTQNRSLGHDLMANENNKRRRQRVRLNHDEKSAKVLRQKEGEATQERSYEIAPGAVDVAAAAFQLRTLPLAPGRSFELPVFTGSKSFNLRAQVEGVERIQTKLGEREVFRVRVQTAFDGRFQSKRDLFAFVTTDEHRLPIRIDAEFVLGTLTAELVDFKQGRRVAQAPTVPPVLGSSGL